MTLKITMAKTLCDLGQRGVSVYHFLGMLGTRWDCGRESQPHSTGAKKDVLLSGYPGRKPPTSPAQPRASVPGGSQPYPVPWLPQEPVLWCYRQTKCAENVLLFVLCYLLQLPRWARQVQGILISKLAGTTTTGQWCNENWPRPGDSLAPCPRVSDTSLNTVPCCLCGVGGCHILRDRAFPQIL